MRKEVVRGEEVVRVGGGGDGREVHKMHTYGCSWVSLKAREARKPTRSLLSPWTFKSFCPWKPPASVGTIRCCNSLGTWREATYDQTGMISYRLHPHLFLQINPCLPFHPSPPYAHVVLFLHGLLLDLVVLVFRGDLAHPVGEGRAV